MAPAESKMIMGYLPIEGRHYLALLAYLETLHVVLGIYIWRLVLRFVERVID